MVNLTKKCAVLRRQLKTMSSDLNKNNTKHDISNDQSVNNLTVDNTNKGTRHMSEPNIRGYTHARSVSVPCSPWIDSQTYHGAHDSYTKVCIYYITKLKCISVT